VSLEYDDFDALDLALGQVHRMLDQDGDARTASLVAAAVLRLRWRARAAQTPAEPPSNQCRREPHAATHPSGMAWRSAARTSWRSMTR
jgi:hypothetical protein